jgi:hypothetical protein
VPYATRVQVLARAGRLRNAWTETSQPSLPDIDGFLEDVSAMVDAVLASRGFTAPSQDATVTSSLADMVAYGALLRALDAQFPAASGPQEVQELRRVASRTWDAGIKSVADGDHPAVVYLESLSSAPGTTDFWSEHPEYAWSGTPETDPLQTNAYLAPGVARTDSF